MVYYVETYRLYHFNTSPPAVREICVRTHRAGRGPDWKTPDQIRNWLAPSMTSVMQVEARSVAEALAIVAESAAGIKHIPPVKRVF